MRTLLLSLALLCPLACGVAQDEGVLYSAGFEESVAEFTTMDQEAKVALTTEPDVIFKGRGALQLSFLQRPFKMDGAEMGMPGTLVHQIAQPSDKMRSISFAVAVAHSTGVATMLAEGEDGPRYICMMWCEAGEWHQPTLTLGDFMHDDDSPLDPDGKPTPEKITNIVLLDMGGFLRAMVEEAGMFYVPPPEEQTIWLDEFKILSTEPERPTAPEGLVAICDYTPPPSRVFFLGGKNLSATQDEAEQDKHIKLDYTVPARTIAAAAHMLRPGSLKDIQAIRFRAKSTGTVTLLVAMEEKRGQGPGNNTNYSAAVTVDGLAPWKDITVPIASFRPDENQVDPNGKLDLDLVGTVVIADITAMGAGADIKNTLWLADLVGLK